MRNPPKRNMKTKSAVLPRKEPSSSMRQYLYLGAGEREGLQYRKLTAGHPVLHGKASQETSCCKLLHPRKLSQECKPRAEQCKLYLTPLTPRKERGTCCASARAHPSNGHCSPQQQHCQLPFWQGLPCSKQRWGAGGHSFNSKEPREEPTAPDCCQGKPCWGGRWMGIASKPKWEQRTSLRPKDTEISC